MDLRAFAALAPEDEAGSQAMAPQPAATSEQPPPAPAGSADVTGPDPRLAGTELELGDGLTERERQVLAFEKQWWRRAGAKEQAIRDVFEVSAPTYYQMLNALLENPAALQYDPVLVGRLRRLRQNRSRSRGRMSPRTAA